MKQRRELEEALRHDLLQVCAHLLDRYAYDGGQVGAGAGAGAPLGPLGLALRGAAAVARHTPIALEELEADPIGGQEFMQHLAVPRRALPSRRAADYASAAGTPYAVAAPAMPRTWTSWTSAGRPPRAAVAWLLALVEAYRGRIAEHLSGIDEAINEAVAFRGARSVYGMRDIARIGEFDRQLRAGDGALGALRKRLVDLGGHGIVASWRLPAPFPRGASWKALRDLWFGLEDQRAAAAEIARDLARRAEVGVDLAYLYQRWCGWRLVEGLQAAGWRPRTDPLPALLLSGAIEFERSGDGPRFLELLCEPRLASRKAPVRGITAAVGELTPDYVLLVHRAEGLVDAHVLDPTLSLDTDHRRSKRKYLRYIQLEGSRIVAGVKVVAGPLRAWAAAPLAGTRCVLDSEDWRGSHGTVPMNPVEYHGTALADWLADL